MRIEDAPPSGGGEGTTWPAARKAGALVFVGGHTPHDPATGRLVLGTADLPGDAAASLRASVLFTEVVAGRLRAQTWRVLLNLQQTLERTGSSIRHVVHIRVFLHDVADEGPVLDLLRRFFGDDLCSGEVVEARNEGSDPEILVQMDCVALSVDAGRTEHAWVAGLEPLTAPFPTVTKAGGFLFSSQLAGADPATGEPVIAGRQLSPRAAALLGPLAQQATRLHLPFFLQQAVMWEHLLAILTAFGVDWKSTLYHMNWMRRPMRVFADGSVTRRIMEHTGDYLLTCFPTSGLGVPGAEIAGRIVAILPESGMRKDIRVPIHGISNSYFGAIKAGPYLFAAGEVPIDTRAWTLVDRAERLEAPRHRLAFGRPYPTAPILPQAHYIYSLYEQTMAAYGGSLADGVHQTVYLCHAGDGPALEGVIADRFAGRPPATTIVPITGASPFAGTRLELEMAAYLGPGDRS
ncbi:hypothetical protein STVA_12300 [Allostella vacuolata]|nr:hypothetical protein STVA_12300 [Stella vacuolata]